MLGWNIGVYRQRKNRRTVPTFDTTEGTRLAVWQTGLGGLDWIDDLVKEGKAVDLGGDGYPNRYAATAAHLLPSVLSGPPEAHETWLSEATDILTDQWVGKTSIDRAAAAKCPAEEWLIVEAWDES